MIENRLRWFVWQDSWSYYEEREIRMVIKINVEESRRKEKSKKRCFVAIKSDMWTTSVGVDDVRSEG